MGVVFRWHESDMHANESTPDSAGRPHKLPKSRRKQMRIVRMMLGKKQTLKLELFAFQFMSRTELPDIALLQNKHSKQISTQRRS
jgi:hypothetical protein